MHETQIWSGETVEGFSFEACLYFEKGYSNGDMPVAIVVFFAAKDSPRDDFGRYMMEQMTIERVNGGYIRVDEPDDELINDPFSLLPWVVHDGVWQNCRKGSDVTYYFDQRHNHAPD